MSVRLRRPGPVGSWRTPVVVAALLVLTGAGCTQGVPSDEPQAQTATPSQTSSADDSASPSSSPGSSASPSGSVSPSGSPSPSGSSTASPSPSPGAVTPTPVGTPTPASAPSTSSVPGETGPPPVLDRNAVGRDLKLSDVFSAPVEWRDDRFDIASDRGLDGFGGPVRRCATDEASAQTAELRLANNFSRLTLRFGEANNSDSSDSEMLVRLVGNGAFITSKQVKFNKLESMTVPVVGVNALKIQVYMTGKNCDDNRGINAVITGLRVE
ncbi:MAG TPA: hypothetical protein VIT20_09375 [Propionibacteriaceae bacterium]